MRVRDGRIIALRSSEEKQFCVFVLVMMNGEWGQVQISLCVLMRACVSALRILNVLPTCLGLLLQHAYYRIYVHSLSGFALLNLSSVSTHNIQSHTH